MVANSTTLAATIALSASIAASNALSKNKFISKLGSTLSKLGSSMSKLGSSLLDKASLITISCFGFFMVWLLWRFVLTNYYNTDQNTIII